VDGSNCVARLAALVGVSGRKRTSFDWPAMESSLGLHLPNDYKYLVEVFPDGTFQDLLHVNRPGDHHQPRTDFLGFYAYTLEDMRHLRSDRGSFPYPIFPEPGGLLPWASGPRREPFFWLTQAEDPNTWPVVTADYDFTEWREFPGTACQLLIEVVEGRFDASLFGVDLAGRGPSFVPMDEDVPVGNGSPSRSFLSLGGRAANEFSALSQVIATTTPATARVDWVEVEDFTGLRLPADYRSFVDTYGPGTFGEITIAAPGGPGGFDLYDLLRRALEAARAPDATRTVPIYPEPNGIIAWGQTADGWTFSWAPTSPDPQAWGVVAYGPHLLAHLADQSFSQFLRSYVKGDSSVADILGHNTPLVVPPRFTPATP
jgi:hypothetical protein